MPIRAIIVGRFRAVSVAVQFFHMMMVIETVQSADAICVSGYKCVMRPGGSTPHVFRYDDSDRIAFKQVPHRVCESRTRRQWHLLF